MSNQFTPLEPLASRFWRKVDIRSSDECWFWKGKLRGEYGGMTIGGKLAGFPKRVVTSNRLAHYLSRGIENIPKSSAGAATDQICHTCDHQLCCNPAHLYKGSSLDNVRDRNARGRTSHHWLGKSRQNMYGAGNPVHKNPGLLIGNNNPNSKARRRLAIVQLYLRRSSLGQASK